MSTSWTVTRALDVHWTPPVPPKKPGRLEKDLEALRPALTDPDTPASHAILRTALKKSISFVAAKAAFVIRDHSLGGFEDELKAAFERFMKDPVKTDPGCRAKLAALEALDHLDSLDSTPFLTAIRTTQREPAWGGPTDTAGGLRARGALGLARQGHVDFMLLMADLLADPEAQVREAAAIAIAHHGAPPGAGLLQLKARVGDPEPAVILACLSGLISLVPGWGVAKAAVHLRGQDGDLHEVAALALDPGHSILNTGPLGMNGSDLPRGTRKACSRRTWSRSQAPSVMTSSGPLAGKSSARWRRSIPGCSSVPPRPRTRTLPAISSGRR